MTGVSDRGWMEHLKDVRQEREAVTVRTRLGEGDTATAVAMCDFTWSTTEGKGRSSVTVLADDDSPLATRDEVHEERCEAV
ncbi:hypothetical protein WBN58_35185 [Saccharothrix sp. CCNWLY140]